MNDSSIRFIIISLQVDENNRLGDNRLQRSVPFDDIVPKIESLYLNENISLTKEHVCLFTLLSESQHPF